MVLLLDDMCGEREVSVGGLALEIIDRLERIGACVTPPKGDCFRNDAEVRDRWVRWGFEELYGKKRPKPIIYSGAFDPEGWKQVSQEMVLEAGAKLRFHSWFSRAIVEDGAVRGVVVETKSGRQAILGRVVIDATGDGDGLDPEHQTKIEIEARRRFMKVAEFVRAHYPGFQRAYILDAAPQLGVRQTRLLEGEYVVTKEDILERRTFPDVVARGRDYYTPYRSLVPKGIEGLLVAGRCYSATSEAQRISREIPPLMVMGEAAGTAAALSLESSVAPRKVDVSGLQKRLVAQGVNLGTR